MSGPSEYQKIPAVDKLLTNSSIKSLLEQYNQKLIVFCIQNVVENIREQIKEGGECPAEGWIIEKIQKEVKGIAQANLQRVINSTGIIIHTNLGGAPFGKQVLGNALKHIEKYNNLEFDLEKGTRGKRDSHVTNILKYLTGAEDVVVVNNNAAAVMLILRVFSKEKEVIVSRGELIEIGGAFRVPDIIKASDCKMVEVGTTNKTKLADYEEAITTETAILLKTHKSNYSIKGFTAEVDLKELSQLGQKNNIPVVFDIGSGLLKRINHKALEEEPDVKQALSSGVDILCFSGDKLLGGPQAGIIVGKKKFIEKIKKEPMMRALRVGKVTLTLLESAARNYLKEDLLFQNNVFFNILTQTDEELLSKAKYLQKALGTKNINSEIVDSLGQFGGGTLPDKELKSYAVKLTIDENNQKRSKIAKRIYHQLLDLEKPVLSILKGANIYFDVLTLDTGEIDVIVENLLLVQRD